MAKLILDYVNENDFFSDGDTEENDIREYIKNKEEPEKIFETDERWPSFYYLSDVRRNLLSWYDFGEQKDILEIGGGMGALTGLLCEKGRSVTVIELTLRRANAILERYSNMKNLEIYVGNYNHIQLEKKFDYITMIGVLEYQGNYTHTNTNPYIDFLKRAKTMLKPGGKLLIAIENRFGLKYWCGVAEDHLAIPYEGIAGYPRSSNIRTFSKKELEDLLEEAGLPYYKFYYPLPDYKIPQVIFSEEHLPQRDINMVNIPYYLWPYSMLVPEKNLYKDIIENNVFEFFANSFLIECGENNDTNCNVIYAKCNTDRKKTYQTSTIISSSGTVKKVAMTEEAVGQLRNLEYNLKFLEAQGLSTVNLSNASQRTLEMQYYDSPTLEEKILKCAANSNSNTMISLIDQYWNLLLQSSPTVKKHLLNSKLMDCEDNNNLGPILEKCFIDLTPNNIFWSENELICFDQEFCMDNMPANYIMFRALKNLYYFNPNLEESISLNYYCQKYGITDILWHFYEKCDLNFLESLRENGMQKALKRWQYYDENAMANNRKMLMTSNQNASLVSELKAKISDLETEFHCMQEEYRKCTENLKKSLMIYQADASAKGTLLAHKNQEVHALELNLSKKNAEIIMLKKQLNT